VDGEPSGTAFRYVTENKIGVFYWVDDSLGYALSGALERQQLYKLAHIVYEQINN
jgi:anti-sigma factor RsiW